MNNIPSYILYINEGVIWYLNSHTFVEGMKLYIDPKIYNKFKNSFV